MNNQGTVKPPNVWRAYDTERGAVCFLVAEYSPDSQTYTRRLSPVEAKAVGGDTLTGYFNTLKRFHVYTRQAAMQQAKRRGYDYFTVADALLTKGECAGFKRTWRGKVIEA